MLAYVEKDQVRLINKKQNSRTLQYPELQQLPDLLAADKAILDGEIIVLKDGRPSFPSLMRRDGSSSRQTIEYMVQLMPISYALFDIVFWQQKDLTSWPLSDRYQLLAEILDFSSPLLHLVDNFPDGQSLFEAIKAREMEGIVAKRKASPYVSGKQHRNWFKIKNRQRINCLIVGYTMRQQRVNSLLLGLFQDEELLYVGRAGSGLREKDKDLLSQFLPDLAIPQPMFKGPLPTAGLETIFVQPLLSVGIEFAEWSEKMQLRSPVIKEFNPVKPERCIL